VRERAGVFGVAGSAMQIVRSVVVDCHVDDVSEFLADRYRVESDRVTFELEPVWTSTRVTRREEMNVRAPHVVQPLLRLVAGHKAARELRALKQALEREPRRP
jgi:hypothetical protein